jgi:hypothetical protein
VKVWIVTATPEHAVGFAAQNRCTALVLNREPVRLLVTSQTTGELMAVIRIEPEMQLNSFRAYAFDVFLEFAVYFSVEIADLPVVTLSVQEPPQMARVAAQTMPAPVTDVTPVNYRDRPVDKCVICGKKMTPRRGKFCCSEKCRQAKKRQQIPIPEDTQS